MTATTRFTVPLILAVGLLVCGGCESSLPLVSEPASTPSTLSSPVPTELQVVEVPDACDITTPAELAAILGSPEPKGQQLPSGGWVASQCAWTSPFTSFLVSIGTAKSLTVFSADESTDAKSRLDDYRARALSSRGPTEVADIGDGAVIGPAGLAFATGEFYVEVLRLQLSEDHLVAIARLIARRL